MKGPGPHEDGYGRIVAILRDELLDGWPGPPEHTVVRD